MSPSYCVNYTERVETNLLDDGVDPGLIVCGRRCIDTTYHRAMVLR